jgi:hypothetical protein
MPSGYQTRGQLMAALAKGGGARILEDVVLHKPPPAPAPLRTLLALVQDLAEAHGWKGMHTYNAHGPDTGLLVQLVREVLIYAEVHPVKGQLSPVQVDWLAALQATGHCETYVWTLEDLPAIEARLRRPRA